MNWYLQALKKYAVFGGRARRMEYWMFMLFYMIIYIALVAVTSYVGGAVIGGIVVMVYSLAMIIPSLAVSVRRMHDIGRSGWWILFPIVNLIFLFMDSQAEENEYGPNPKMA
jgi:uncharacterized membrane protein YhaH (DUF805 family)